MGKYAMRALYCGLLLVAVLMAACRPEPEALVLMPTVALFPTRTATPTPPPPTPTNRPTATPTPVLSATPTLTIAPTLTTAPTATIGTTPFPVFCEETLTQAVQRAVDACDGTLPGLVCMGTRDTAVSLSLAEQNPRTRSGDTFPTDIVTQIDAAPLDALNGIYGVGLARLDASQLGPLPIGQDISLLLFGGGTLQNQILSRTEQLDVQVATPVNRQTEFDPPMTRFLVETGVPNTRCDFVPTGLLVQSPGPAQLSINTLDLDMSGTLLVQAQAGGEMRLIVLAGNASFTLLDQERMLLPGTQTSLRLQDSLLPNTPPEPVTPYDPRSVANLFEQAAPLLALLPQAVQPPRAPAPDELTQFISYSGTWVVNTRVTRLAGLLGEGERVSEVAIRDAQQLCEWTGGRLLGTPSSFGFELREEGDRRFLTIQGTYPGARFPAQLVRVPGTENTYAGSAEGENGARFDHIFEFDASTAFRWRMTADNLPGTVCSSATVVGEGARTVAERAPASARRQSLEAWRISIDADASAVPGDACLDNSLFAETPPSALLSLARAEDGLTLSANVPDVPFPQTFAIAPDDLNAYVGSITEDGREYRHQIGFSSEAAFEWQLTVVDMDSGCVVGVLQGAGSRF